MKIFIVTIFIYVISYSPLFATVNCAKEDLLGSNSCLGDGINQEEFLWYKSINQDRGENGLDSLSISPSLSIIANRHARYLEEKQASISYDEFDCSYNYGEQMSSICLWKTLQSFASLYLDDNHDAIKVQVIPLEELHIWRQSNDNKIIIDNNVAEENSWNTLGIGVFQDYAVLWFGQKNKFIMHRRLTRLTNKQSDRIIELYSSYFNRAADTNGLIFWKSSFETYIKNVEEDQALSLIAKDMSASREYQILYPPYMSVNNFINQVYRNLLNRESDREGVAFWSGHINNGTLTREQAILNMIEGAKNNTSSRGKFDAQLIVNKNIISKYFADALKSNDIDLAKKAFGKVTSNSKTISDSIVALDQCMVSKRSNSSNRTIGRPTTLSNFKSISKWGNTHINVCWENPSFSNQHHRQLVKTAVAETWVKHSQIKFIGWEQCLNGSKGIHVIFNNRGWPHTKGLGKQLDGKRNGMLLSANFGRCISDECIKGITIHEFGHALGFAHEQARKDTPESCESRQQNGETDGDMYIGVWDIDSIMNYCNPNYNNNGKLSTTDIMAVQQIYGKPEPKKPEPKKPEPKKPEPKKPEPKKPEPKKPEPKKPEPKKPEPKKPEPKKPEPKKPEPKKPEPKKPEPKKPEPKKPEPKKPEPKKPEPKKPIDCPL